MSIDIIVICLTAILCCIILAGGINRAAFYLSEAIDTKNALDMARDIADKIEALKKEEKGNVIDIKRREKHDN